MKKLTTLAFTWLLSLHTWAAAPANKPIFSCWDGSFAYNIIKVFDNGSDYKIIAQTQSPTIFKFLGDLDLDDWGETKLEIHIEKQACFVDEKNTLVSCSLAESTAQVVTLFPKDGPTPKIQPVDLSLLDLELIRAERTANQGIVREHRLIIGQTDPFRLYGGVNINFGINWQSNTDKCNPSQW